MITATDRGHLMVFPGVMENKINRVESLADEQIETKHIIKVAHEVLNVKIAYTQKCYGNY